MSLDKTKLDRSRTSEIASMISLEQTSKEVKKADLIQETLDSGLIKADASTSIDAYMAAIVAQLETLVSASDAGVASYAAEESAKSTLETEEEQAIVFVAEEEDEVSDGPFSKQKGGSLALTLDAYIDSINAQLESVKLRRDRASLMINQELVCVQAAANNVVKMGWMEFGMHMATAVGMAAGVGASVRGMSSINTNNTALNLEIDGFRNAKGNLSTKAKALDEIASARNLPAGNPFRNAAEGNIAAGPVDLAVVAGGRVEVDRLRGERRGDRLLDITDVPADPTHGGLLPPVPAGGARDPFASLRKLNTRDVQALTHLDNAEIPNMRTMFGKEIEHCDLDVNRIANEKNTHVNSTNIETQMWKGIGEGIGQTVSAGLAAGKAVEEANKMQNELAGRYAGQDVQLNNETASARESDINSSIRLLREITGADIRG